MDSKKNRFDQLFQMANGKPKPNNCNESFCDVLYPLIEKRLQLNAEGDLEAIDRLGIRRFSKKNAKNVMTGLEYLEELKSHEVYEYFFASPDDAAHSNDANSDRVMSREDFEKLSNAEQLTLARDGKAPERAPIEEVISKLSNAEQLTRARAAKAAQDKTDNKE